MPLPVVLGLDLATFRCGWAVGDGTEPPVAGCWDFAQVGNKIGRLLQGVDEHLLIVVRRFGVTHVAFESPILKQTDRLLTIRKIYGVEAHVEWRCEPEQLDLVCNEVDAKVAKYELAGNRNAEKEDVARVAEKIGVVLPTGPGRLDAGDATAVWKVGIRTWSPAAINSKWDSLIWGSRWAR